MFGMVNYILPLLLYIKSIKLSLNYEKNYIDSAKLNFEVYIIIRKDFIYLKVSEIGMTILDSNRQREIYNIVNVVKQRLKEELFIEDETQEKLIELFYEFDGNYSTKRSSHQIIGWVL